MATWAHIVTQFIGVIFLLAAGPKLFRPYKFQQSLDQLDLIPRVSKKYLARVVPLIELLIGCMLVASFWVISALLIAGVMLLAFAVVLAGNVVNEHSVVSCGCFGGSVRHIGWFDVHCNFVLGLIALSSAVIIYKQGGSLDLISQEYPTAHHTLIWAALFGMAIYSAFVYRSFSELRELIIVGKYRLTTDKPAED